MLAWLCNTRNVVCHYRSLAKEHPWAIVAIPDGQNFHQKVQALPIIKSKYLYTRRKVSVSSVERSPFVVANSVDAEVTCVFNFFPCIQISIERK